MKHLILLFAAWMTFASLAQAQTAGLYQGSITVTRTNAALRVNDVTTLLIRGECYMDNLTYTPAMLWTATNLDAASKLSNAWCRHNFGYVFDPNNVSDMLLEGTGGTEIRIPGGSVVPKTLKLTPTVISWKTTKKIGLDVYPYQRPTTVTTSFYFARVGNTPPPQP